MVCRGGLPAHDARRVEVSAAFERIFPRELKKGPGFLKDPGHISFLHSENRIAGKTGAGLDYCVLPGPAAENLMAKRNSQNLTPN